MNEHRLLQVSEVEQAFAGRTVLRGISFDIRRGEVLGLIGPNGSGKTTTIRTILDFYKPRAGTIRLMGTDCNRSFEKVGRRIGVMLESSGVYPLLTGREYLEFYGHIWGIPDERLASRVDDALEQTDLTGVQHRRVATYSKGMIQRLAFGRAVLNRPELLILDEPFDGIDVEAKRNLMKLILDFGREGHGVLITSHNLKEVDELCNRLVFLREGRIIHDSTKEEIRRLYSGQAVFHIAFQPEAEDGHIRALFPEGDYDPGAKLLSIRLSADCTREQIMERLYDHRLPIREAYEKDKDMEDIYLEFIKSH